MDSERFLMMPMQLYYDATAKTKQSSEKVEAIKQDVNHEFIASEKHDGEACMIIKMNNVISIRSRNISVKTKRYGDYTAKLPHIVEDFKNIPDNTVVLAELCVNDGTNHANRNTMSTDVGCILRSLPPLALKKQEQHGKVVAVIFDCLMHDGHDLVDCPYEARVSVIQQFFPSEEPQNILLQETFKPVMKYVYHTKFMYDHFNDFFNSVMDKNGEGLVLVRRDYKYSPSKRTAWQTLKWKKHTESYDLKVVDTEDFTKEYTGKQLDKWLYFVDEHDNKIDVNNITDRSGLIPVTKGWYYGWKAAVLCEYNGTTIRCSSGLTDEDRALLAEQNMQDYITAGVLYAEVSGMQTATQGRLRHPIVNRLRIMN